MPNSSFSELTLLAVEAAKNAGALLHQGFGSNFEIDSKPGMQNLVTEYDLIAEKAIITTLSERFPDHSFLTEESGSINKASGSVTWIIDPLDGTVNFAHNIPVFSVSIAACVGGAIVSGVVFHPMAQELFVAEKGKGSYLNTKPISVSRTTDLSKALLSTGFPYDVDKDPLNCVEKFAKMQLKGVPVRRLGSAAIDLAYVAAGRWDAYWEVGLHPWDMAAGKLLVEEAGGVISHWDGAPHEVFSYSTMLASNTHLQATMLEFLK